MSGISTNTAQVLAITQIKYGSRGPFCLSFRQVELRNALTASAGDVVRRSGHHALVKSEAGYEVRDLEADRARLFAASPPLQETETYFGGIAALHQHHSGTAEVLR